MTLLLYKLKFKQRSSTLVKLNNLMAASQVSGTRLMFENDKVIANYNKTG